MKTDSFTGGESLALGAGDTNHPVSSRLYQVMDRVAFVMLCVFCAECAIGSSGRWLSFGPVSIRMVLFGLAFLCTLPNVWLQRRRPFQISFAIIVTVFFLWLLVSALIGYQNGNATEFIRNDITGFLTLALIPGAVLTLNSGTRLRQMTNVLFYASLGLSIVVLIIHYSIPFQWIDLYQLNELINEFALGGLADIGFGVLRIYFRSQIFMQLTIVIGIWKIATEQKNRIRNTISTGVIVFALLLSFARGYWVGFVIALCLYLILARKTGRAKWAATFAVLAVTVLLMIASWTLYTKPYVFRAFASRMDSRIMVLLPTFGGQLDFLTPSENIGDSEDPIYLDPTLSKENVEAANIRIKSIEEQYKLFMEKPVAGWGLGKNLDGIRTDGKTEYMYWDLLTKTGLIGVMLLVAVCAYHPVRLMCKIHAARRKKAETPYAPRDVTHLTYVYVAGLISVAATSYVNPYLSTPLGLAILLITIAACRLSYAEIDSSRPEDIPQSSSHDKENVI
jgi:hypothetical protein